MLFCSGGVGALRPYRTTCDVEQVNGTSTLTHTVYSTRTRGQKMMITCTKKKIDRRRRMVEAKDSTRENTAAATEREKMCSLS